MAGCVVHPGAIEPYEHLAPAELERLAPGLSVSPRAVTYYVRLARSAGRVLEFGAGRGALTWEMARDGARVAAVDVSKRLVAQLERRATAEPRAVARRVRAHLGDMRTLRLARRFPLVLAPSGTFLHLYNRQDVERFLQNVRDHLTQDGRFVFDVALPRPEDLEGDYDPVAQVLFRSSSQGPVLAQRQYFPRELEMLLWYNGFREIRFAADFARRRPRPGARVLVVTARPHSNRASC